MDKDHLDRSNRSEPDPGWLGSWISAEHLGATAIDACRRHFDASPERRLVVDDFLREDTAGDVGRFLTREARFRPSYGLYHQSGETTREEWHAAAAKKRFYRYRVLDEGQWSDEGSTARATYLELRRALADRRFGDYCAALTGLDFGDEVEVGTHGMERGDFLRRHRDLGRGRRLAFLVYLAPDWRREWGGTLRLHGDDGRDTAVVPRYNRLLLFDVVADRGHHVDPIAVAAGTRRRVSVGGWLHGPSPSAV